jgi:dihydrofolate reductase
MKVILYMAMTLNGYIAKEDDETPWSDESWAAYRDFVQRTKNIIIGGYTYDLLNEDPAFREKIGNPLVVAVSRSQKKKGDPTDVIVSSPREALQVVASAGFSEALVEGGGGINASFLKENFIDEIIVDIDPVIWGKGKKIFNDVDVDANLELIAVGKHSEKLARLHYRVVK